MLSKDSTTNPLRALLLPHTPSHNSYVLYFFDTKKADINDRHNLYRGSIFYFFRRGKSTYIFRYGKIFFKNNLQNIVFQRNIFRSLPSKKPHKSILSNSKNKNLTVFDNKKQPKNIYKKTLLCGGIGFSAFGFLWKTCNLARY